jgi:hypothetical protein
VLSASPALTGVPTAPTAAAGDNSTTVATTAFTTAVASLPGGLFRNLKVQATSDTSVTASTDEIIVENPSTHGTLRLIAPSVTISTALSGAGGIDTGSVASSTWYSVWIEAKTDGTTSGIFSTSSTAPALASGYSLQARVGWVRSDASSHLWRTIQNGRRATIAVGTNPATNIILASGAAGNVATPTWVAIPVPNFIPPTAYSIAGSLWTTSNGVAAVASNNSAAAYTSSTNSPPVANNPGTSGGLAMQQFNFVLESSNIYWASSSSSTVSVTSWEDNL